MFCTQCGKKIQDDAKFCPYCGVTIHPTEDSKEPPVKPVEPAEPVEPTGKPRQQVHRLSSQVRKLWPSDKKRRIWNIVGICIILLILFIAGHDGSDVSKNEQAMSDPAKQEEKQAPAKIPAPASITSFEVDENMIGEPVAFIQVKNDSDKTIDGLKIRVTAQDNFGKDVTEFGSGRISGLISQRTIEPHGSLDANSYWTLHGLENGRKFHIELAEIHYTDGTSWNSSSSDPVTADTKQTDKQVGV